MSEDAAHLGESELTLGALAGEIAALREEARRWRQESAQARAEVTALRAELARTPARGDGAVSSPHPESVWPDQAPGDPGTGGASGTTEQTAPVSRRGALLALGGAAAGGVGLALGSALLDAQPAAAINPSLILDQANTGTALTSLTTPAVDNAALEVENSSGATALYGISNGLTSLVSGFFEAGVLGENNAGGYGVVGACNGGTEAWGVFGVAGNYSGINYGPGAFGVYGDTNLSQGIGVMGTSSGGDGVQGITNLSGSSGVAGFDTVASFPAGYGVSGSSTAGIGVHGISDGAAAVRPGLTTGVFGESSGGFGVYGATDTGYGIAGGADNITGVAISGFNAGGGPQLQLYPFGSSLPPTSSPGQFVVLNDNTLHYAYATNEWQELAPQVNGLTSTDGQNAVTGMDSSPDGGIGVSGVSAKGLGLYGESDAAAGVAISGHNTAGGPQLALTPSTAVTVPATTAPGQFIVLADGSLHYAYATDEWLTVTSTVTIAPVRVIDTTVGTGGITGPLTPGATVHTSSTLTGVGAIPAAATGLIGNFAISGVGGALLNGFGVATIYPAGQAVPATANINAGAGCFAISNSVTVGVGNGGKVAIVWDGGGPVPSAHAFFDVTGYII